MAKTYSLLVAIVLMGRYYMLTKVNTLNKVGVKEKGVVVVTGGSSGIGLALAHKFASNGFINLILVARSYDNLEKAKKAILENVPAAKIECLSVDLSEVNAAEVLFQKLADRKLLVLVNNAGIGYEGSFTSMNQEKVGSLMNLNCVSVAQLSQLFLAYMAKTDSSGTLVNISSSAGETMSADVVLYSATKAFVTALSKAITVESIYNTFFLRRYSPNVRVVTCIPGAVKTNFGAEDIICFQMKGANCSAEEAAASMMEVVLANTITGKILSVLDEDTAYPNGATNQFIMRVLLQVLPQGVSSILSSLAWMSTKKLPQALQSVLHGT